jgi:hypothetical protein
MSPTPNTPATTSKWEGLPLSQELDARQLDNIKAHLDIILLALEALTNISSDEMLKAGEELKLEAIIADRVGLWRLRQSNPLRKSSGGRKKLDVEEARALVLIVCYLAKQHHELIRRAVTLLEQITEQNKAPHQTALLGDYLDTFTNNYRDRMNEEESISSEHLSRLALKLLIDLLFYSAANGHRRLWLALLDYAR